MDITALEERLSRLEQEVAELRRENQSLRAAATTTVARTESASLPRRDLLKGVACAAAGAAGLSLLGSSPSEAATGNLIYGADNDAGSSYTKWTSRHPDQTLELVNSSSFEGGHALRALGHGGVLGLADFGDTGHAIEGDARTGGNSIHGYKFWPDGHAVAGISAHTSSTWAAVAGVTKGSGPGCYGRGDGKGNGVWGQINDSAKSQSAVLGTTEGQGAAIEGNSILGRGGVFKGKKAAVRLVASGSKNKPSTGTRGDLFVDSSGRLWYCKTGGVATGWVQLA